MIEPKQAQTAEDVALHYNELAHWYLEIWGEHVHHGLWERGNEAAARAVDRLAHRMAEAIELKPHDRVCDIGCGYGAAARLLAKHYQAEVIGVTLSEQQWASARMKTTDAANPDYLLMDFLENSFDDARFDAAFSIESSEHMPDKPKFFNEMFRILRPGGRIGVFAWLAREDAKGWEVDWLLEPICREGRLPSMGAPSDYEGWLRDAGFTDLRCIDYSEQVKKTWPIIAWRMARRLAWDPEARKFLAGPAANRIFAKTVFTIWAAYELGSMRYGLFTARRPD